MLFTTCLNCYSHILQSRRTLRGAAVAIIAPFTLLKLLHCKTPNRILSIIIKRKKNNWYYCIMYILIELIETT